MTAIGRIVDVWRYPVKSMAGERLTTATLGWQGIDGDRQYAFYKPADRGSFPWLTGRDWPAATLLRAAYRDPEIPRVSLVEVLTPEGRWLAIDAPELLAMLSKGAGEELRLMQVARGAFDLMPVSIATTAMHRALDEAHGAPLDQRRFRTNILIDSDATEIPRGARLALGDWPDSAAAVIADPIPRCAMITIDPDTGERQPPVMRTVAQEFANRFGIYAATAAPGKIRVGDQVTIALP